VRENRRVYTKDMIILALYALPADMDNAVAALCSASGASRYDAAYRLRVAEKTPVVVGAYALPADAEAVSRKLTSDGFKTIIMDRNERKLLEESFLVRTFSFEDALLRVASRKKEEISIEYGKVDLIIYGRGIRSETETIIEKSRKLSLGRTVMTSGLMMTKKGEKHHENVTEESEGFIYLYDREKAVVVFRENEVDCSSLGGAMKPTRFANIAFIAGELKRRSGNASYDDSLLNKNVQKQILGPLFDPGVDLDIAVSLIAAASRGRNLEAE